MAYKVYSIESRKGGVGKTTIALNLAQQLLKKGPVLLLDCDITGTSISDPASNSLYWKDNTNVLRDENGIPYNLLGYFLDHFIKGTSNMNDFTKEGKLKESKINVIGSQLYGPSSRSIVDTRELMDEIHSYWLMEFVNQIITSFKNNYKGKDVHIIIDNSPGFVGFCQALHSYMLRLGPETAKILMVSSIDEQDLKSGLNACMEIRNFVNDRVAVANCYASLSKTKNAVADSQIEELIENDSELKKFYYSLIEDKKLLESYYNKNFSEKDYLALILNKVPKSLTDDNIDYDFSEVLNNDELKFFYAITSAKNSQPQNIINYDETISYQYYIKYLHSQTDETSRVSYWPRRFKDLEVQNLEYQKMEDRMGAISKVATIYNNLNSNLTQRGYSRVAKTFPSSWNPSASIDNLQVIIARIAKRVATNKTITLSPEDVERIHSWNLRNLDSFHSLVSIDDVTLELQSIYEYVESYCKDNDDDNSQLLFVIVSLFLHVSLKILKEISNSNVSLRESIIKDWEGQSSANLWKDFVSNSLYSSLRLDLKSLPLERLFELYFDQFFHDFCVAFIRLMDLHIDFDVILKTLKIYILGSSTISFNREIIDYLTKVICQKSEVFNEDKLSTLMNISFVMKRVQDVVRDNILKNWT